MISRLFTSGQYSTGNTLFLMPIAFLFIILMLAGSLCFVVAAEDSALPDAFDVNDLLWEIKLGSHQYTTPIINGGQLFIGVDDYNLEHSVLTKNGGGVLKRLDPVTGKTVWQMVIPRYEEGNIAPSHFNKWRCGVCSQPAIEGKRLYIVGPRGDVICLDRNGQTDGNDGPFLNEAEYMEAPADYKLQKTDGDIIWEYNMLAGVKVVPHDVCGSSPVLVGDYLYACTSNGQDNRHKYIVNPDAPALIALDKNTGKLAAVETEGISKGTFHCNWSSPVAATVDGKTFILFGGGNGVLYAFAPVLRTGDKPQALKKIWEYDCCPADYRYLDGKAKTYSTHSKRSADGPSEIISIPTVVGGRVYVAIGQSPNHGAGQGMLTCIDVATGKKVWESAKVDRTTAQAAIDNGLLYISDFSGKLHCMDADSGQIYWQHDLGAGVWCASPIVAKGKVYISTEDKVLWILKAGKEKEVLSRSRLRSLAITPMAHNGVLYLPTQKRLFAVKNSSKTHSEGNSGSRK